MRDGGWVERIWYGGDAIAVAMRAALLPFSRVYGAVTAIRSSMYERGVFQSEPPALPTISIGNLTVGGTGKTPVAAWVATELERRGARPAIVLRGYGDDEPRVHEILNPAVPVIVAKNRVDGIAQARARGATVAVLDDAFQHRRVRRTVDLLLVSADRWSPIVRLLPAGPWREPLRASGRATLIVITRKAATAAATDEVGRALSRVVPGTRLAAIHIAPRELTDLATGRHLPLTVLAGRRVHVLAAVGDPTAFIRQLEAHGGHVHAQLYPDHHRFSDAEIGRFAGSLPSDGLAICTLKDAVKLADRWPREAPSLWYVSQHIIVERGAGEVERVLDQLTRAHAPVAS